MDGWIKLHRKLMESESFYKLTAVQKLIAIYIVLNANHEDGIWYDKYKGIEVEVKRGQLVTSRNKIVNEWFNKDKDVTEQRVRTCLDKLVRINFITKSPANDYTLITVVNYDIYQSKKDDDNQVLTKSQPSGNQAITTNKNDKNDKKKHYAENVLLTEKEYVKLCSEKGKHLIDECIDYLSKYKIEKGYKTKSDNLTIRRWVIEAVTKYKGGQASYQPKIEEPIQIDPYLEAAYEQRGMGTDPRSA